MLSQVRAIGSSCFARVNVTIDGRAFAGEESETIKDFCAKQNIQIPGKCRSALECNLCKVESNGKPVLACAAHLVEGQKISTQSETIRKEILGTIDRIKNPTAFDKTARKTIENPSVKSTLVDTTTQSVQLDYSKCVDCGACVEACQHHSLILNKHLEPAGNFSLYSSGCSACGQCISSCKTGALSKTNNIPMYKEAMSNKSAAKIAVLDMSIMYILETELNLKPGTMSLDSVCILLHNMGFDYFLDASLITDYEIINDASRIYKHSTKGYSQTIGAFCPSLTKQFLNTDETGADTVAEVFLGPMSQFTTFVVSDCLAKRANSTLFMGEPRVYSSVGITSQEFVQIIKESKASFNGEPCKMMPLGSYEGVSSVTAERFANSVVNTFGHSFLGANIPPISFKSVDPLVSVSKFDIASNYPVNVATIKGAKGLEKLYSLNLNDLIYISPMECTTCIPPASIPSIDAESVKRAVKYAMDNDKAQEIWKYFKKQEDDEAFINKPTGYFD